MMFTMTIVIGHRKMLFYKIFSSQAILSGGRGQLGALCSVVGLLCSVVWPCERLETIYFYQHHHHTLESGRHEFRLFGKISLVGLRETVWHCGKEDCLPIKIAPGSMSGSIIYMLCHTLCTSTFLSPF